MPQDVYLTRFAGGPVDRADGRARLRVARKDAGDLDPFALVEERLGMLLVDAAEHLVVAERHGHGRARKGGAVRLLLRLDDQVVHTLLHHIHAVPRRRIR